MEGESPTLNVRKSRDIELNINNKLYLTKKWVWWHINIWKILSEVVIGVTHRGRLFLLLLILIASIKLQLLPRLCSFLLFDHNTLYFELVFLWIKHLLPPSKLKLIFNFCISFLTFQSCWKFFRQENLTITVMVVFLMRWQDSICSGEKLQLILSKIFNSFSASASPLTCTMYTNSRMYRHSCIGHFLRIVPPA